MIVTCERCQARARLPDARLESSAELRVRCVKCQHVFTVKRSAAEAAAPPVPPSLPSPPAPAASSPPSEFDPFGFGEVLKEGHAAAPDPESTALDDPFADLSVSEPPHGEEPPEEVSFMGPLAVSEEQSVERSLRSERRDLFGSASGATELSDDPFVSSAPGDGGEDPFGAPTPPPTPTPQPPPPASRSGFKAPLLPELGMEAPQAGRVDPTVPLPPTRAAPVSSSGSVHLEGNLGREVLFVPTPASNIVERVASAPPRPSEAPLRGMPRALAQAATGVLLLTFTALVVLLWVRDSQLTESAPLSIAGVRALFSPPGAYRLSDVTNGLYETVGGRAVLYVRGEVQNVGETPARVRLRIELLDGEQLVRVAETVAGRLPSPEELYLLQSVADVDALSTQLAAAGTELAPRAKAPFFVLWYEYPTRLEGLTVRVKPSEVVRQASR